MKKAAILLLIPLLFFGCQKRKRISLSGAFAIYPLAVKWAEEYQKLHPKIRIDVSAGGAGKGMADALSGNVDIGMLSREVNPAEEEKGAFSIAIAIDAVIPTFNSNNPYADSIKSKGLSKEEFEGIWITKNIQTWAQALDQEASNSTINVYTRSDAAGGPETWAKYLGKKQEDLQGIGIFGDPGLAEAIKKDKLGIGFNNVSYIYDMKNGLPYPNLSVLPIDLNSDGKISDDENFYGTINEVMKAIAEGKYPSPPARDLYFVTKGKTKDKEVYDFLNWILTEGQKYVAEAGYVKLTDAQIQQQLQKLK